MVLADHIHMRACLAMLWLQLRRTQPLSPSRRASCDDFSPPLEQRCHDSELAPENVLSSTSPAGQLHLGSPALAAVRRC